MTNDEVGKGGIGGRWLAVETAPGGDCGRHEASLRRLGSLGTQRLKITIECVHERARTVKNHVADDTESKSGLQTVV
jgi:hypothetical protein